MRPHCERDKGITEPLRKKQMRNTQSSYHDVGRELYEEAMEKTQKPCQGKEHWAQISWKRGKGKSGIRGTRGPGMRFLLYPFYN